MPRLGSRLLFALPLVLVGLAAGVWLRKAVDPPPADDPPKPPELATATVGGVRYEAEHRPGEVVVSTRDGTLDIRRGPDFLDLADGVLVINGVGFPLPKSGDVVRWNLDGPLLINGQPVAPHPLQPRPLDAAGADLQWAVAGPSPTPRDTLSVAWAGPLLVVAHGDGLVRVWGADRKVVRSVTPAPPKDGRGGWGLRAAVSPDGKTVAAANLLGDGVTLWDAATGGYVAALPAPPGKVTGVGFAANDWLLEARGPALLARHLGGDRSKVVPLGAVHTGFTVPFALGGDGGTLARNDGKVVAVSRLTPAGDTLTATPAATIPGATPDGVMAVSPDGGLVAVSDGTGKPALYDAATGAVRHRLRWRATEEKVTVGAMAFLPDGKTLAVGGGPSVRLYDVPSGRERGWVACDEVRALAASADGQTLAAGLRHSPGVRLWAVSDLLK